MRYCCRLELQKLAISPNGDVSVLVYGGKPSWRSKTKGVTTAQLVRLRPGNANVYGEVEEKTTLLERLFPDDPGLNTINDMIAENAGRSHLYCFWENGPMFKGGIKMHFVYAHLKKDDFRNKKDDPIALVGGLIPLALFSGRSKHGPFRACQYLIKNYKRKAIERSVKDKMNAYIMGDADSSFNSEVEDAVLRKDNGSLKKLILKGTNTQLFKILLKMHKRYLFLESDGVVGGVASSTVWLDMLNNKSTSIDETIGNREARARTQRTDPALDRRRIRVSDDWSDDSSSSDDDLTA